MQQDSGLEPEQASTSLKTSPPQAPTDQARESAFDPTTKEPSYDSNRRNRVKRCTCYTYKDKECVYYCHLDVIWVNTPERMVPYGMSSYRGSQRARRSVADNKMTPRCFCAKQVDTHCNSFCGTRYLLVFCKSLSSCSC
ncbi:Endothelin-3 [Bagarius yarrelli]|uniref:Endothelin-3 n=1 Tax=Bagarius yarrelli TaxID=175774 RepID=A0A556V978_BAGYA|nr:Endothelin-3 [Bagarius yarrelli]